MSVFISDDLDLDIKRHLREEDEFAQDRPICNCCEMPCFGDKYYEHGGEIICNDCLLTYFTRFID